MSRARWFVIGQALKPRARLTLTVLSFLLPVMMWSLVSYVPWIWHPLVKINSPGDIAWFKSGLLVERSVFAEENSKVAAVGGKVADGARANPVFLPAPHEVARAFWTAFRTKPQLRGDLWLHESLWLSIRTIFWGFVISSLVGVPLGILCGAYPPISRLAEPVIDFVRYMPAPAFGALAVAVLGIFDAPKIAVIVIGTFFQQVLIIANTVRRHDPALVEAAQTLGARPWQLLRRVIVPSCIVDLYNDQRILLGWAWTYLIVAEVVGVSSGITFFINQQAKYRNFENVYAAIVIIGVIGLASDQLLSFIGQRIFAWKNPRPSRIRNFFSRIFSRRPIVMLAAQSSSTPDQP